MEHGGIIRAVSRWRWRKSRGLLGGLIRLNFTGRGIGISVGGKGFRLSRGADGKLRRSASVPGTGLYRRD